MDRHKRQEYMLSWAANDLSEFVESHDDFLKQELENEGKFPPSWFAVLHQSYVVLRSSGCSTDSIHDMLQRIEYHQKQKYKSEKHEDVSLIEGFIL